jgi:hypothetical protein
MIDLHEVINIYEMILFYINLNFYLSVKDSKGLDYLNSQIKIIFYFY